MFIFIWMLYGLATISSANLTCDSLDSYMKDFIDSVLKEEYQELNKYAADSVRNKVLDGDVSTVILTKVEELEIVDSVVSHDPKGNPEMARFILRYKIEGEPSARYGLLFWIHFEEGWRFVTLPFSIYGRFPFQYVET